jgi:hypothetical protein
MCLLKDARQCSTVHEYMTYDLTPLSDRSVPCQVQKWLPRTGRLLHSRYALLCPIGQLAQLINWLEFFRQYVNPDQLINWVPIYESLLTYWPVLTLVIVAMVFCLHKEMPNAYIHFQEDSCSASTYSTKYSVIYFLLWSFLGPISTSL